MLQSKTFYLDRNIKFGWFMGTRILEKQIRIEICCNYMDIINGKIDNSFPWLNHVTIRTIWLNPVCEFPLIFVVRKFRENSYLELNLQWLFFCPFDLVTKEVWYRLACYWINIQKLDLAIITMISLGKWKGCIWILEGSDTNWKIRYKQKIFNRATFRLHCNNHLCVTYRDCCAKFASGICIIVKSAFLFNFLTKFDYKHLK